MAALNHNLYARTRSISLSFYRQAENCIKSEGVFCPFFYGQEASFLF